MRVIPVIDLKNGQAVAAREGFRERYAPLTSCLTERTDPGAVIQGLRSMHAFDTFYLADLDALMGRGTQWPMLKELAEHYADFCFWLDQGLPDLKLLAGWPSNVIPVIGTESLNAEDLRSWAVCGTDFILSLDFRGDALIGDAAIVEETDCWPDRVIVMSLSRVGSGRGPDFAQLRAFRRRHPERRLIAAGGVRDAVDLDALEGIGLHAVLVASALHSGALAGETLESY